MIGALKNHTPQPVKSAVRRATRWIQRRPKPAILMYHRIARSSFDPWGLAVEEPNFGAQLEWLASHRSVLPLAQFAKRHREGSLPADAIAITFDDGYSSALRAAIPLLERFGLHATIFLPSAQIESGSEFWWDELVRIVVDFDGESLGMPEADVCVPPPHTRDRSWLPDAPPDTPRQVLFYSLWSKLRCMPPDALDRTMKHLREQATQRLAEEDRAIAADELRTIMSDAVTFGSHAVNHPSLPTLSAEQQQREIGESRERIASLTGVMPNSFAYPYGDCDERTRQLVQRAGFECACTAQHTFVSPRADVLALPRLRVGNIGANGLRNMLRGA